jgi:hypothetical protein
VEAAAALAGVPEWVPALLLQGFAGVWADWMFHVPLSYQVQVFCHLLESHSDQYSTDPACQPAPD